MPFSPEEIEHMDWLTLLRGYDELAGGASMRGGGIDYRRLGEAARDDQDAPVQETAPAAPAVPLPGQGIDAHSCDRLVGALEEMRILLRTGCGGAGTRGVHSGGPAIAAPALAADQVLARPRYLVPLLDIKQEAVLRLLTLGWFGASVWFWLWWFAADRGGWGVGRGIATAALGWLFLLSGYFLFFACRMTRPNPRQPVPDLRVAMVVTKAPAEPWPVVERTLHAMLDQDFPYPYDVWLADEHPSGKTLRWCQGHGVRVSSRHGVAAYHQPTWPRRTRCKEGNLAYFYDRVGYNEYDIVAQLDSDHVPEPGYLAAMVRPFADPGVGYVAAPSLCDSNAAQGWTVRGRLYRDASMHGPVQAGCNGGWAPVCIGSHYAVRTIALREVGGLGPELAEDYSTTLWLQSAGWDGVFAIDAEAHGEGPGSLDDMLIQELQWARSLGTILVRWAPGRYRSIPWRARIRLSFALLFYLLQGGIWATATLLPSAAVVFDATWGNSSLTSFYLRLWLCSTLLLLVLAWIRRCGVLRPRRAKLWSWEVVLFQLVRWPWTGLGFIHGMWQGCHQTGAQFKVTPKSSQQARQLSGRLLVPPLVLGLIPASVILLAPKPQRALGLYLLTLGQTVCYLGVVAAVVVLHVVANRRQQLSQRRRRAMTNSPSRRENRPWRRRLTDGWGLWWAIGGSAALFAGSAILTATAGIAWRLTHLNLVP